MEHDEKMTENLLPDDSTEHSECLQESPSLEKAFSETEDLLGEFSDKEHDTSEILQSYLKGLCNSGSKKHRKRCISKDLG